MKNILRTVAHLMSVVLVFFFPLHAVAQDGTAGQLPVYSSPVLITEVQTGAASASDEFVELYNVSDAPIDITGWQVRYNNASSAIQDTSLITTVTTAGGQDVVLNPHQYFVLYTATVSVPATILGQIYSAKLSNADKVVALYSPDQATCQMEARDAVAWGASTSGEGSAVTMTGSQTNDRLVRRYRNTSGYYLDTGHNDSDFVMTPVTKTTAINGIAADASPGADNTALDSSISPLVASSDVSLAPIPIDGCSVPVDVASDEGEGSGTLQQADDSPPASIEPTNDTTGDVDVVAPAIPVADSDLMAPQLSELLPNPANPLTDADDEFIELYNPNDVQFDLSGFVIESGKHHYTFPTGTIIEPKAFKAFFSGQTHVTLSNTGGQVLLLDPLGSAIGQTQPYATAKDNYAWVLAAGVWQWTTEPTPNAANMVAAPVAKTATKAVSVVTKSAVKGASTQKSKSTKPAKVTTASTQTAMSNVVARTPLHPGVLALVGSFALLYGAYEYRSDVANRIHQLRVYRTARRENRQNAKGRRGD
jgi:Lamin Tail Domain